MLAHDSDVLDLAPLAPRLTPSVAQAAQIMLSDEKLVHDYNLVGVAGNLLDTPVAASVSVSPLESNAGHPTGHHHHADPVSVNPEGQAPPRDAGDRSEESHSPCAPSLPPLPQEVPPLRLQIAPGFIIPPEICPPERYPTEFDELKLPDFSTHKQPHQSPDTMQDAPLSSAPPALPEIPVASPPLGREMPLMQTTEATVVDGGSHVPGELTVNSPSFNSTLDDGVEHVDGEDTLSDPSLGINLNDAWGAIDQAFESLSLQERFHHTLSKLVDGSGASTSTGVVIDMPTARPLDSQCNFSEFRGCRPRHCGPSAFSSEAR